MLLLHYNFSILTFPTQFTPVVYTKIHICSYINTGMSTRHVHSNSYLQQVLSTQSLYILSVNESAESFYFHDVN